MSFFRELARRNVVKVAGLYVVAAWLLLQVADVLTDMLPVPEWTGTLVFLLLLLGFPVETIQHLPQIFRTAVDVLADLEGIAHAQFPGCGRHELHEPLGTGR